MTGSDLEGGCGGVYPLTLPATYSCILPTASLLHEEAFKQGLAFPPKIRVKASPILFFPPLSVDGVSKVRYGSGKVIPASELETKFPYPRSQIAAGHAYTSRMVNLNCQLEWL